MGIESESEIICSVRPGTGDGPCKLGADRAGRGTGQRRVLEGI